jgi:branched-chain amino acid transport system permease protein
LLRASAQWRYVLFAAIVIVVMVVRPQGLMTAALVRRFLGLAQDVSLRGRERRA